MASDDALEALARRLHWEMERLESDDFGAWEALTEFQKDFYRFCISGLLDQPDLVQLALTRHQLRKSPQ